MASLFLERLAQHAFLDRADLHQRAVATAVLDGGPRFEAADADGAERELEHQARTRLEHSGAPELRADREAPFGGVEAGTEVANLEDADCRVVTLDRDGKARVLAGCTLAVRPRDETFEPFDGRGRRRDESRHFLRRQESEQRWR